MAINQPKGKAKSTLKLPGKVIKRDETTDAMVKEGLKQAKDPSYLQAVEALLPDE